MSRVILEVRRRAAPAPDRETDRRGTRLEAEVHNVCIEWARWSRTRRFYGAPAPVGSIMAALTRVPGRSDGPNARIDPEMARFQMAVIDLGTGTERRIFEAHFLSPALNVSAVAEQLGCSRTHWYRTVNAFARRAYQAAFGGIGTGY